MNQLTALNYEELKQWFLQANQTELLNLDNKDMAYLLATLTPYEDRLFYNNQIRLRLLNQWFDNEESWEEYPVSRKTLFERYKEVTGSLPEVTVPTLYLFNYFIGTGRVNHLVTA